MVWDGTESLSKRCSCPSEVCLFSVEGVKFSPEFSREELRGAECSFFTVQSAHLGNLEVRHPRCVVE